MAYVRVNDLWLPEAFVPNFGTGTITIDATGELAVWIGQVSWQNRAVTSRAIRKVKFLLGSVVKAGGSGWDLSIQALDAANGPPARPDGTPIVNVAIANGDAGFVSSAYYTSGNFSADHTVTFGDRLAIVLGFDGAGRLGADAASIPTCGTFNSNAYNDGMVSFLASAWSAPNVNNTIVLEFADGTFGCLTPCWPISSTTITQNINTGTTPDEVATKWTPTFKCKVDRLVAYLSAGATANFDLVFYQGTTVLDSVSFDANTLRSTSSLPVVGVIPEIEVTPGVDYYISVLPTTANNVTTRHYDVANTDFLTFMAGDTQMYAATRTNAGAWSAAVNTRRQLIGVGLSAIDDGAGGGGGGAGGARIIGGTIAR